jgi:hypothetical protein
MAYNPGVGDISGQLLGQGIASFGQGIAQGIQKGEQERNILQEASGRGKALANAFKGLEQLGIMPEGTAEQFRALQEKTAPREMIGLIDGAAKTIGTLMEGGMQMQQVKAREAQVRAQQQALAQAMGAATVAIKQAKQPDGTYDPVVAADVYQANGGTDIRVLENAMQMAKASRGPDPTAAMQNTQAVIDAERAAGVLKTPEDEARRRAALMAKGGHDQPERYGAAAVYVDRETGGNPIRAITNLSDGRVGTVDESGVFRALDLGKYKPTTASDANVFLDAPEMKKLADKVVEQENGIKELNRFLKTAGGLPQGAEKIATRFSAAIKTALTDEPLTEKEKSLGISKARQERLLGALRTTVLGPGVLTENDAARIINAVGGDVNSIFTNPEILQEAVGELLSEKLNTYQQDLRLYNRHVEGRYSSAGYNWREGVEPYKPEPKKEAPQSNEQTKSIGGVEYIKTPEGWVRK